MKIVSENSEQEIERQRALRQLDAALRELTANLLRVMRGAGKDYMIAKQAVDLALAAQRYAEVAGVNPTYEMGEILHEPYDVEFRRKLSREQNDRLDAEELALRGATQILASRLLSQRPQEASGTNEFYRGVNEIIEAREALRAVRTEGFMAGRAKRKAASAKKRKPPEKNTWDDLLTDC